MNIQEELDKKLADSINKFIQSIFKEALKRKGYEFDNDDEMIEFIKLNVNAFTDIDGDTFYHIGDKGLLMRVKKEPKLDFDFKAENIEYDLCDDWYFID